MIRGAGLPRSFTESALIAATQEWKDLKIDVLVFYKLRQITRVVVDPSTSVMVLRASTAKVKPFSDRKLIAATLGKGGYEVKQREKFIKKGKIPKPKAYKYYGAQISLENVYRIAKQISKQSMSITFAGTVKQVLGTVDTLGIQVEGEHPKQIIERIDSKFITVPPEADIIPLLDDLGQPVNLKIGVTCIATDTIEEVDPKIEESTESEKTITS